MRGENHDSHTIKNVLLTLAAGWQTLRRLPGRGREGSIQHGESTTENSRKKPDDKVARERR